MLMRLLKKRKETLSQNKEKAFLSRKLVTLKSDVPVNDKLEDFKLKEIDKEKLYDFLREMEFNRLLSQAINFYGESKKLKNLSNSETKNIKIDKKKYFNITNEKKLDEIIKSMNEEEEISVDTETTSINPQEAELVGISLSNKKGESCYIPVGHKNVKNLPKSLVIKRLKKILEDKSIKKIGQNIKYDLIVLKKRGIDLFPIEDTMLLSYTLDAGLNRHNLDTLSEIHLNHKNISYKDLVGTGKNKKNFQEVELSQATQYASEDADVTFKLYQILKKRLKNESLNHIYETFEKPLVNILASLEINGIKVDDNYLKTLSKKFETRIKKIEKNIYDLSGREFNIASPKQLGEIIYNELKIAKLKRTKKGSLATSANILEDLAYSGHKFPKLVLEWRQLSKLKNTYTDALQNHINSKTKKSSYVFFC